jgi:RNA methyltransferase, TrmH family
MADPISKAKLSAYRKLHSKKAREAENRFLIEGWHLLEEAIAAKVPLRTVIFDDSRELSDNDLRVKEAAVRRAEVVYTASESQLRALSDTQTSASVVAEIDRIQGDWETVLAALAGKQRSFCDLCGADAAIMGLGCPELENGKLVRATMGGLFHMPIAPVGSIRNALSVLQDNGYRIVASSLGDSESMVGFDWPKKTVLVVGNEARGVSRSVLDLADTCLRIPKYGRGESLNAAMAASVMLSNWRS